MTSTTTIRKSYGNRKLYSFPEDYPLRLVKPKNSSSNNAPKKTEDVAKLLKYIDDNIVGKNNAFLGPFGRRKVVFCDYIASGRSLQFIEEYIVREVLPCFGNTHSTTNITSLQTTLFRHEAREIIKNAVNASDEDALILTGQGCTGAVKKLIAALDLREPPIVFTGSSEDYDNIKLWQEIGTKIIRISETKEGYLDLNDLEGQLRLHHNTGRQLIGCFSYASNVTGILADDVASTLLLHQYGALAFWDYNVAAPNVLIDMNPLVPGVEENSLGKDAIYFSGHKFIGGVQTPGILIVRKSLLKRTAVEGNDGFFEPQERNKGFELQEEGNAAAVVESIRVGLVMQLKETITIPSIMQRQEKITKQMLQQIRTIPEIILLGNKSTLLKRLPVFSFMVRHPRGTFLHHNFVCAVLNDVFGIQARGGCASAGPYLQDLLGIDQNLADQYENMILEDRRLSSLNLSMQNSTLELLRPGFTRISLPYFINDSELAFVMEAVKMVATEGWKLLPQYVVDLETGEWRHHSNSISKDRKWLGSIRYVDGKMTMNERRISGPGLFPQNYSECLQTARNLFNRARKTANRNPYPNQGLHFDVRGEKLRWFMLPQEAQDLLTTNAQNVKHNLPFDPMGYLGSKRNDKKEEKICVNPALSPGMTSRHYSLPGIDDPRLNGCPLSPVPYFIPEPFQSAMSRPMTQPQFIQGPPNFAVGECVNSAIFNPVPAATAMYHRERCMSLGDPTISPPPPPPPLLSPQTRASLGIANFRRRNCSCSSQTDLQSLDSDVNTSPTHSLNMLYASTNDCSQYGRASPSPSVDLHAYVSEISKELATSIKSEIREVINKVEDVLENTDSVDMSNIMFSCNERHGSGSEDGRSDSISANDVAEYLEKVSREMANEVKSEIRDVVSAVDVFITPENQDRHSFSRASSAGDSDRFNPGPMQKYMPSSSTETAVETINKSNSANKLSDEEPSEKTNKTKLLASTVTSVSSQDSGINLSFHEQEHFTNEFAKRRSSSESSASRQLRQESEKLRYSTLQRQNKSELIERNNGDEMENLRVTNPAGSKFICTPKNIWQPTVEAIQEYEMIKDGDKVMVCLSGGKDSLSLLHTLLQYQSYVQSKGILFSLGAVTVDPDASGCDPCILIPHLKQMGVHYVVEDQSDVQSETGSFQQTKENLCSFCTSDKRHRLYATAKSCGYNVIAIGQHLDDLCESFILSIFHTGKLRTMKAHYYIKEQGLRVIRPFVYVREKAIRQFVVSQKLPANLEINHYDNPKERQRARQMLVQQEIVLPKLYGNMRSAMHPIIGFQFDDTEIKIKRKVKSKDSEDISEVETDEEPITKAD